jgi:hypothetical protein
MTPLDVPTLALFAGALTFLAGLMLLTLAVLIDLHTSRRPPCPCDRPAASDRP